MSETGHELNTPKSSERAGLGTTRGYVSSMDGKNHKIGRLADSGDAGEDWEEDADDLFRVERSHNIASRMEQKQPRERAAVKKTESNNKETHSRYADKNQMSDMSWQEKLKLRNKKRRNRILAAFGILLLAAYTGVAVYFGFHFYDGTTVYGIDCSQMTVAEVKQEVGEKLQDYVLTIDERGDKQETISAAEAGLRFVDNSSIDQMIRDQKCYIWPVMMLMEKAQVPSVAFAIDEEQAQKSMDLLDCMNPIYTVAPQDAYIETTETGFEIKEEVMGTTLDKEKTWDLVLDALNTGITEINLEDCYINPEIYQDNEDLQHIAAEKNRLGSANITFDFGDRSEVVDPALIETWMVTLTDGTYVIDDMCVTNYVENLAAKYDTFGLPRTFYTSLGTVETLYYGDYGWCMDQDATVLKLLRAMEEGYQGTMEPDYVYTGMCRDENDIGDTYVEICISQQTMWCYEYGNLLVQTPVVTGNPNKDNATPSGGVWAIDAKKRNAVLTGEGYSAPVDYWMPFNGNVGIHDLQSRAYFGGTIYLSAGSHGCVNTPYDAVQLIYNAVSIGTPVVVYE